MTKLKEKKQEEKITAQERSILCRKKIQEVLDKFNCTLLARPSYRLRDDGTWSLVTTVEIVPSNV